ncbi:outer membrane beta-barrel protein [Helicobacter mustelae]|uniref:Putative outer membrane protein n=1 Tax=Helicobacter mustelae (strain ATCC 43772 / CCUG 25715 / CIP 103759 / LMG 18044 / NCTC 12198 / R85-136P) TaxID=679897 RepID=D3UGG5_HELM1|nr:outer membrane beta-barrel protein [Helicobacter mustelae]CBG39586.1 Putative outer membrane protein [Helicobacter mustelae 12198]SQH71098.1 outer membrane protein [Helicobacter mustelae]
MKKILLSFFFAVGASAIENHPFVGIGTSFGSGLRTNFSQIVTKSVNSCPGDVCIGGQSSANYLGKTSPLGLKLFLGNETVFDKYHISGIRFYGSVDMQNASLGAISGPIQKTAPRDKSFNTIVGQSNNGPVIGQVNMLSPKTQQDFLFANGVLTTLSLNLDFFANIPLGYFIKQYAAPKFPLLLDIGLFIGTGVEFSMLKSKYWVNETSGREQSFLASGSGFFLNLGGNIYITSHDRIQIGVKIPFYQLNHQEWNNYVDTDVNSNVAIWSEQTLKQSFVIKKSPELSISYIFYF